MGTEPCALVNPSVGCFVARCLRARFRHGKYRREDATRKTLQVCQHPPARFRPGKAPADPLSIAAQFLRLLFRFGCRCLNLGHNCYLYSLKVTTLSSTTVGLGREAPILSLLTDELRQWIGRESNYTAPEEIGRASIRYFALAIGDDNRLYFDNEYAQTVGYPGVIAPPTFICETNQYAHRQPDADGYIGHSWDLPLSGCRMIRGGHEYEFFQPVTPEDRISVNWRLEDIFERNSSRGGTMLIVMAVAAFSNQRGEMLARNRETLIFQPLENLARSEGSSTAEAPARAAQSEEQTVTSIAPPSSAGELRVGTLCPALERRLSLVRMIAYAGATWDWARLHYDPAYVAERKLPAPVIDGQMLGALLSEALLDWLGPHALIRKLKFRLRAMVFADTTVRCTGEVTALTTEDAQRLVTVAQRVCVSDRVIADGTAVVRLPA
jgi:acyl dehydratase